MPRRQNSIEKIIKGKIKNTEENIMNEQNFYKSAMENCKIFNIRLILNNYIGERTRIHNNLKITNEKIRIPTWEFNYKVFDIETFKNKN